MSQFWIDKILLVVVTILSSAGLFKLINAIISRNRTKAETDNIIANTYKELVLQITIQLPVNFTTLSALATDDGTISSYLWTKISGTGGTITSPSSSSTTVIGLTAGVYVYDILVTDNNSLTAHRTVTVTVTALGTIITTRRIRLN